MPPPPASDDSDLDMPDEVPAKGKGKAPAKAANIEEGDDEDSEEEEEEDEYQVEKILSHSFQTNRGKTKVIYEIKWLGYEDEADQTWEPIENLSGAKDLLEAYHRSIGGTPEPPQKGKKPSKASLGKRNSSVAELNSPAPSSKKGRSRKSEANGAAETELPVGSWEDHVTRVSAIVESDEAGSAKTVQELEGLLEWNNGRKTQHKMSTLRQKCPQRLLDYYENHLLKPKLEELAAEDEIR